MCEPTEMLPATQSRIGAFGATATVWSLLVGVAKREGVASLRAIEQVTVYVQPCQNLAGPRHPYPPLFCYLAGVHRAISRRPEDRCDDWFGGHIKRQRRSGYRYLNDLTIDRVCSRVGGTRHVFERVVELDVSIAKKSTHGRMGRVGTLECTPEHVGNFIGDVLAVFSPKRTHKNIYLAVLTQEKCPQPVYEIFEGVFKPLAV